MTGRQRRARRAVALVATAVFIGGLGLGCTRQEEESEMPTPREGRDTIVEFLKNSIEYTDATGWWPKKGSAWVKACGLGHGRRGAQYVYSLWAEGTDDPVSDGLRVAEYWESLGMSVWTANIDIGTPAVFGTGGPVLRASLDTSRAGEGEYSIDAVAYCSEGDAIAIKDEDIAARKRGETFPGDEGTVPIPDPRDKPLSPRDIDKQPSESPIPAPEGSEE